MKIWKQSQQRNQSNVSIMTKLFASGRKVASIYIASLSAVVTAKPPNVKKKKHVPKDILQESATDGKEESVIKILNVSIDILKEKKVQRQERDHFQASRHLRITKVRS